MSSSERTMDEVLVILQEECAEVIQAVSKIHRFGLDDTYNGHTNFYNLVKELGDLRCMINLFLDKHQVDNYEVEEYERHKLEKLKTWSTIFQQS
jgi:NTP pyrophosphatase (non-canonical NTP hydrolase)